MEKTDLEQLEKEIMVMKYHQPLFKTLKRCLTKLGYWKNKRRGDPAKGYKKSRGNNG